MEVIEIKIEEIATSPHQMRKTFFEEEIEELALSIQSVGLLQPLVVKKRGDKFELISGERRLRAVKSLGWQRVPASIMPMDQGDSALSCLIENIQRVDLNPIEIATSCAEIIKEFSLTQDELAQRVGKKRSSIANYLRILNLSPEIKQAIASGLISFGHAKVILSVAGRENQEVLFQKVINNGLSVRDVEKLIKEKPSKKRAIELKEDQLEPFLNEFKEKLMCAIGTKVTFHTSKNSGSIEIHWDSLETLEAILKRLGVLNE